MNEVIFRKPSSKEAQTEAMAHMCAITKLYPAEKLKEIAESDPMEFLVTAAFVTEKQNLVASLLGFDSFEDMEKYVDMGFNVFDKLNED